MLIALSLTLRHMKTPKPHMKDPLSQCHDAPVQVISVDEGTSYAECSACSKPCTPCYESYADIPAPKEEPKKIKPFDARVNNHIGPDGRIIFAEVCHEMLDELATHIEAQDKRIAELMKRMEELEMIDGDTLTHEEI